MRYSGKETPIVPAVLPAGGTVTVQVVHQEANALLALTSNLAVATPIAGLYQFSLANITDPPLGLVQMLVVFTHSGGDRDYVKVTARGVIDEISKTRRMVATIV